MVSILRVHKQSTRYMSAQRPPRHARSSTEHVTYRDIEHARRNDTGSSLVGFSETSVVDRPAVPVPDRLTVIGRR